jgi:uncharacterized protein DUF3142
MMPAWVRRLLIFLPFTCIAGSGTPRRLLPQDAYVWQRQWTPAVVAALQQSSDLVRAWRVLAAQSDERGHLRPTAVEWTAFENNGRPVILVVRIDGQLTQWDEEVLLDDLRAVLSQWRQNRVPVAGVEIDHDCGTARLSAYAHFLAELRTQIEDVVPLSITALPAWLSAPDLAAVLAQADEVVLQVHAVQSPRAGLFDLQLARRWVATLARRSATPFRVALPTYGSRVSWHQDGSLLAVESEAPLLAGGYAAVELMAPPQEVSLFLRGLERDPPAQLLGIVWFRLPTDDDSRAWSLDTWRAVIQGKPLQARIEVLVHNSDTPGMSNLVLINRGDVDAALPRTIELPDVCTLADGINGYTLAHNGSSLVFQQLHGGLLRSRHQQVIGWMRCAPDQGEIRVRP